MEWKEIDEELFNVKAGTYVFVYYNDTQYDRYDLILTLNRRCYQSDSSWKEDIYCSNHNNWNHQPILYAIVPLPEVPEQYKASGGRRDENGAFIEVKDWR